MALPMFMSALVGCSSLHVHTIDSPWESNETSHWKTCKVCHEKFEEHEHTFNTFNDKCFICDYVDPLVHIDEWGEITSLTEYGKTKLTFNVPNKVGDIYVRGIGHDAFNGSQALTVKLNEELDYYYRDSFTNSSIRFIDTEEELVKWEQPDRDGKINKIRVFKDNVAMFNNKFYPTLQEAFDAVDGDDATVTLLRDELKIEDPIEVKHAVSLVSFYSKANLTCNFNIDTSGILYIPETINYQGNVKLILGRADEICAVGEGADDGNKTMVVNTSGALVFVNKEKCPKNVNVCYTYSFDSGEEGTPAHGAKQVVNDAIVALPRNHFAFGTFTFNDNFRAIRGLTKYGLTVNGLNITKVAENVNDAYIGGHAFSVATVVDIETVVDFLVDDLDIRIKFWFLTTKGLFFDLTIGEGIKRVLGCAFNANADDDFTSEASVAVAPLLSHLSSVTIGPDVEEIGDKAFYENVYLSSVSGGENLKIIAPEAFAGCYNLKSVELSHAKNLQEIAMYAFKSCRSLIYMNLPAGIWTYMGYGLNNFGYFPYDMTPEKIAYRFANDANGAWINTFQSTKPYSYTRSTSTDGSGAYVEVTYTDKLSEAMEKCAEGGEIYIAENKGDKEINLYWNEIVHSNITITAAPGVKNVHIANSKDDPNVTVHSNTSNEKHLILSNVVPKGNVTIQADNNDGVTQHTAGFAIRGVSDNDLPKVDLVTTDEQIKIENLVGSKSVIRGLDYEHTYGMFNFRVDEDKGVTYIHDTSPFGDKVQAMTVTRQTEKAKTVELVDRPKKTPYGNDIVNLTLSSDVKKVGNFFFANFDDLERLVCEEGVESIGERAFEGCDALVLASLPNSVTAIGEAAFNSCDKLSTVNIPVNDELTSLSYQCFRACKALESIDIPNNIIEIGSEAFNDCTSLSEITFSQKLATIGEKAFNNCESLSILQLPASLTSIGESAFDDCENLSGVYLPEGNKLGTIGINAFNNCDNLSFFYFADNINGWKAGEIVLISEDLSDGSIAATYLREEYVDQEWKRS